MIGGDVARLAQQRQQKQQLQVFVAVARECVLLLLLLVRNRGIAWIKNYRQNDVSETACGARDGASRRRERWRGVAGDGARERVAEMSTYELLKRVAVAVITRDVRREVQKVSLVLVCWLAS